ncbi:PDZ domain-containing protein [Sphingomonadaceae bacterium OTU29LAMAA1]|uniref:type II secretion system protein N n=1 Tax=Sphingomonas sp. Leaf37 TaxID=2876552 RepID=UPI001E31CF09|nr:type II secretion system protein N [Sphingomonas sp. Leaf37]USU06129.1 PDZ domain-containing protein [Sphingomonadaceae bacterium OTU29LAMAA1]
MRLKLDARTRRILRRLPVVNVYSLAELLLIAGLATQSARLLWTLVTPVSPLGDWRPAEISVPGRPYDVLAGFDPFFRLGAQAQGPATVTSLQLTLFGIRVDEASGRGSAIVAGADNVQKSVGVGEEIQPGVRLKAVAFDHITIDRGGTSEDLFLVQSDAPQPGQAPVPAPGAPPVVGQPAVPPIAANQIRNEIGFIPRIDGGRISGLVVRPQGTGNLFRTAGLREGDVVTAIGGRPVTGPQDLDRVTADFAGGGNIPITVERGTQTLALAITIAAPK